MLTNCYYRRHRQYLERSLQLLGERFSRDVASHRDDNLRVMQDNMLLIKEINEQRDKNRSVKRALQTQVCKKCLMILP
jgi:cilia- and flagella-associated protein 57